MRPRCICSPSSAHAKPMSSRSANSSGVTATGPVGPKPACDLPSENCGGLPALCSTRSERSWPMVRPATASQACVAGDVAAAAADDDDQLDLPVDLARRAASPRRTGPAMHDGNLVKTKRRFGRLEAGLGRVRPVVQRDREHLPWMRHRRPELDIGDGRPAATSRRRLPTPTRRPSRASAGAHVGPANRPLLAVSTSTHTAVRDEHEAGRRPSRSARASERCRHVRGVVRLAPRHDVLRSTPTSSISASIASPGCR